ncbi:MAG: class I SAM-dependent methyltransferase [Lachnospiraceae bacterium]|nr:class I SAM-dependent methyltransferase [Lachnospiraceae bacterium]
MDAYTDFASVYDTFMDETPYQEWADFIEELIHEYGVSVPYKNKKVQVESGADSQELLNTEKNLVVDIGCGTGTLTEMLAAKGYDMIGIDLSQEMLQIAIDKKETNQSDVLYLCQDMRELDLYSTAGTIISVCDSVNYLLEKEELVETFRLVNNYLYPGGVFIFDFNTQYKYEEVIGDTTIAENREDCSFIWENYYHEEEQINEYDLTVFVKEQNGLYRKFEENHYQRGYTLAEMIRMIERAGLCLIKAIDADTHEEPTPESERIYIVAREQGKGC